MEFDEKARYGQALNLAWMLYMNPDSKIESYDAVINKALAIKDKLINPYWEKIFESKQKIDIDENKGMELVM